MTYIRNTKYISVMAKKPIPKKKGETNHVALGLAIILLAVLTLGGIVGGAGRGGQLFARGAYWLLGAGELIMPLALATGGILLIRKRSIEASTREIISGSLGLVSLLTLLSIYERGLGGIIGRLLSSVLIAAFDPIFSGLILAFLATGSLTVFFDRTPNLFPFFTSLWLRLKGIFVKQKDLQIVNAMQVEDIPETKPSQDIAKREAPRQEAKSELVINDPSLEEVIIDTKRHKMVYGAYVPPPLSLLEGDRGKANVGDVKGNANIIRRTLGNFGIEVEMDEITIGPTVTRYALKPAQGVKLSRIVGLQNDLSLALAAHPLRIEAPIPGKALVGIEVPNKTKATVGLASLLSDPLFSSPKPLLAALGRNIAGKPVFYSIAKMPHLLIAGTTGSGKSVTIHAIISSLLYRHGPDDLRFIFVDPKRVELTLYNGIPHLLCPVVTDSKKAIMTLKWAAVEMNRRYDILEGYAVRDIESYHKVLAENKGIKPKDGEQEMDRMPYIVIIIDELADIMSSYPREMEAGIVRLAQMSRAVGIHLILSTQRPEVNVITGLIKANVPSRIALRVPTQIDSRTILDASGAEKLLGMGDMLAMVGTSQAERLQSAFITEDEVKKVVKYLKEAHKEDIREMIELSATNITGDKVMFGDDMDNDNDGDALYEDARECVIEAGKASTSYIQRKLKVGYARAARLMDMLEERGIIGPPDGAKPRAVLDRPIKNAASDEIHADMVAAAKSMEESETELY